MLPLTFLCPPTYGAISENENVVHQKSPPTKTTGTDVLNLRNMCSALQFSIGSYNRSCWKI